MSTASVHSTSGAPASGAMDIYERWLHARAMQRAQNPYELLGITPLETNRNRIRATVERRQSEIEKYEAEAAPDLWAAFRQEFDEAIGVLADDERKGLLDAALRRQHAASSQVETSVAASAASLMSSGTAGAPCGQCRQMNPRDRKFCSSCGAALWDVCPKCRAAKLASERFCGQCGVDCVASIAGQVAHFDEQLALAKRLQAAARFADARRLVREMARVEDPRFEAHARQAAVLLDEFAAGQREQEAAVELAVQRAQQLVQQHAYATALETLQGVPEPLRGSDFQRVFAEAGQRQCESEEILANIRTGLAQKQTVTLLPLIERFLALKPDHSQATKLATQITAQVVAQATQRKDAKDWHAALDLLRKVPEFAVSDAVRSLREECDEYVWLAREVRQSSVLHPCLPGLADRLVELNPGRDEIVTLAQQLKQRQANPPKSAWRAVHDWQAAPQRTALGLPVDWWGGLQRIAVAEDCRLTTARVALGRWCVAIGLALQALGKASLDVNFVAAEKTGVLGRLTSGFRRRGPTVAWGIDLTDSALKAVRLRWDEAAQRATIEASELHEPHLAADGTAETSRDSWRLEALKQFAATHDLSEAKIAVNLSAQQSLARFCQLPLAKGKKFDDLVRFEAQHQFPMPLDELVWEYVDLRGEPADPQAEAATTAPVLLLASRRFVVDARRAMFDQAGIKVDVMQCDAIALHNLLRFDPLRETNDDGAVADEVIAVLDVGAESSSFLVSGANFAWFRTFAAGGDDCTKAIARELKLARKQAEHGKRQLHRVRKIARVAAAWAPILGQIRGECERSLTQWKTLDAQRLPQRLLCVGGGAQTYGLVDALRGT